MTSHVIKLAWESGSSADAPDSLEVAPAYGAHLSSLLRRENEPVSALTGEPLQALTKAGVICN